MLEWNWDESCKCHRASDSTAIYVISGDTELGYKVGFFPGPGPECTWKSGFTDLEQAKSSAEDCVEHVRELQKQWGCDPEPTSQEQ